MPSPDDTPNLLDYAAGIAARDAAITQVEEHADPYWNRAVDFAIRAVASEHDEFTTDDVWQMLHDLAIPAPHEPRALGAAMQRAGRTKLIIATDRVKQSARAECHARPVRVWRSMVTA